MRIVLLLGEKEMLNGLLLTTLAVMTVFVLGWRCTDIILRILYWPLSWCVYHIEERIARNSASCMHCGEHYRQWRDPRGQLCPSCGNNVLGYSLGKRQIDTDRYTYKTLAQKLNTCGCVGKEMKPSVLYPRMLLCAECALDEAGFIKPLNKTE